MKFGDSFEEERIDAARSQANEQPPAPPGAEEAADLDHPCKRTCSGWQQGYERGHQRFVNEDDSMWKAKYIAERDRASKEIEEAKRAAVLSSIQETFYKSKCEELTAEVTALQRKLEDAKQFAEEMRQTAVNLAENLAEAQRERDELREEVEKLKAQAAKDTLFLAGEVKHLQAQIAEAQAKALLFDSMKAERDELRAKLAAEQGLFRDLSTQHFDALECIARLRKALEEITLFEPGKGSVKIWPHTAVTKIYDIARKALEAK